MNTRRASYAMSPHAIASCESLLTLPAFLPCFRLRAMDMAIIDKS